MGFLDDVKKAAKTAGEGAKKAATQGKEKVEEMQVKRQMDDAAKRLGYLYHRERTENVHAGADADQLISEITKLKADLEDDGAAGDSDAGEPSA